MSSSESENEDVEAKKKEEEQARLEADVINKDDDAEEAKEMLESIISLLVVKKQEKSLLNPGQVGKPLPDLNQHSLNPQRLLEVEGELSKKQQRELKRYNF